MSRPCTCPGCGAGCSRHDHMGDNWRCDNCGDEWPEDAETYCRQHDLFDCPYAHG